MRTLHIYGVIQKQLVCLRAVSKRYGRDSLLVYLSYADVSIDKMFAGNAAFGKVKCNMRLWCFSGSETTTKKGYFYVRNLRKLDTSVLQRCRQIH